MKKLFLIPTNKPSRLGYLTKKGKEVYKDLRLFERLMPNILDSENQDIYITNDEVIREGDWFVKPKYSNAIKVGYEISQADSSYFEGYGYDWTDCKKIILTTNQDLVGVQEIEDEFLEWFVQNSTCEEVEIEEQSNTIEISNMLYTEYNYEIVIPKLEPKPHSFCETPEAKCTMNYCDENGCQNRKRVLVEPKQETWKQNIANLLSHPLYKRISKIGNVDNGWFMLRYKKDEERITPDDSWKDIVDVCNKMLGISNG